MKRLKKILAMVMSLAMVLGMTVTAFANASSQPVTPSANDRAEVKITGLGNVTVALYQIAEGKYGANGAQGFIEYVWNVTGTDGSSPVFANVDAPTADEINLLAQRIQHKTTNTSDYLTLTEYSAADMNAQVANGTYTANVPVGAYIAIITGTADANGENKTIYNPILLTASYGAAGATAGTLSGGDVNASDTYLFGTTAVAKMTTPDFEKSVSGATPDKNSQNQTISTGSVGQELTYTLDNITMPSYPANAKNKTFFISDTMVAGLTFKYDSLQIKVNGVTYDKDGSGNFKFNDANQTVFATAAVSGNGFNINFDYDKLVSDATTNAVYTPIVTYKAVINSSAVVGVSGNKNTAKLYYATKPNNGSTWDTPDDTPKGDKADGVEEIKKEKIVYTYQLAFKKTGENGVSLNGAVFGIYTGMPCTSANLIDTVTSDENGYAVSTRVGAGKYYVKEIWAPDGYSLNDKTYVVEAKWTTATKTITGTVTSREYTTSVNEAVKVNGEVTQVGWIKDGVFYNLNQKPDGADSGTDQVVFKAYIKEGSESSTTSITEERITNDSNPAGTVYEVKVADNSGNGIGTAATSIPNSKLSSLPSTGGIGTTIFTIGGCIIMIIAAGLFFASRRKKAEN